jgi:hypothetical protein
MDKHIKQLVIEKFGMSIEEFERCKLSDLPIKINQSNIFSGNDSDINYKYFAVSCYFIMEHIKSIPGINKYIIGYYEIYDNIIFINQKQHLSLNLLNAPNHILVKIPIKLLDIDIIVKNTMNSEKYIPFGYGNHNTYNARVSDVNAHLSIQKIEIDRWNMINIFRIIKIIIIFNLYTCIIILFANDWLLWPLLFLGIGVSLFMIFQKHTYLSVSYRGNADDRHAITYTNNSIIFTETVIHYRYDDIRYMVETIDSKTIPEKDYRYIIFRRKHIIR